MHVKMFICVLLLTMFYEHADTFILGGEQCVVPSPCMCYSNAIDCEGKDITTLPRILPFQASSADFYLKFQQNKLASIPSHAFQNISMTHGAKIFLLLQNNSISTVSDGAFSGVETVVKHLDIGNNKLSSIPLAIRHLTHLETLLLYGNPIATIDGRVFADLRDSLNSLSISLENMPVWPWEFYLLRHLQALSIDHIPFQSIPIDVFNGFAIYDLSLSNTHLNQIPGEICNLKNLMSFSFKENQALHPKLSFDHLCHEPLAHVTDVEVSGNEFFTVSSGLFTTFPQMTTLNLRQNRIRYIAYEEMPVNSRIVKLFLDSNLLTSIPYAVNKLRMLQMLTISHNQIFIIDHNTMADLQHLTWLDMSNNPLEHIDKDAFRNQTSMLQTLDLRNTNLDNIPIAITTVPRLTSVYFDMFNDTECSCNNMGHLRHWNVNGVNITGSCTNSETIKVYLINSLPQCPLT